MYTTAVVADGGSVVGYAFVLEAGGGTDVEEASDPPVGAGALVPPPPAAFVGAWRLIPVIVGTATYCGLYVP
jgi:hypothetical protein